jgi:hypothetical protein
MRSKAIIDALHAGGALIKYKDQHWFMKDRTGKLLSASHIRNKTACKIIREWPGSLHYCKSGDYEGWRRKAGMAVEPEAKKPLRGVCRECGCMENDACSIVEGFGGMIQACSWTDETQTLCNHPDCVRAAS